MIRRRFLQLAGIASVLAPFEAMSAEAARTVIYHVAGFSCPTCATGLDTMLRQQPGIVSSQSTYPDGKVTIRFHPRQTTEAAMIQFIADLGFTVKG